MSSLVAGCVVLLYEPERPDAEELGYQERESYGHDHGKVHCLPHFFPVAEACDLGDQTQEEYDRAPQVYTLVHFLTCIELNGHEKGFCWIIAYISLFVNV